MDGKVISKKALKKQSRRFSGLSDSKLESRMLVPKYRDEHAEIEEKNRFAKPSANSSEGIANPPAVTDRLIKK